MVNEQSPIANIDKFCIVYFNEILIFSRTAEEHERHIKIIRRAFNEAGNLDKCKFFATQIRFLLHIINKDSSHPNPQNVKKVLNWPTPQTITEVCCFINLV